MNIPRHKKVGVRLILTIILAAVFLPIYLSNLKEVPFHPDESSWIFMSRDFETLFLLRDRAAFEWSLAGGQPATIDILYRLLNAPVAKYMIGLSWWLNGNTAADLNNDWVWKESWDFNQSNGSLPKPNLLWASRLPGAIMSALAVVLIFLIGSEVGGLGVGLAAALFLGFNPLILLHSRRAMAEAAQLFFTLAAVLGCIHLTRACEDPSILCLIGPSQTDRRAEQTGSDFRTARFQRIGAGFFNNLVRILGFVGVGVLIGFAVSSKQTMLILMPIALLATAPLLKHTSLFGHRLIILLSIWLALGLGFSLTFYILNPILYQHPVSGAAAMIAARNHVVDSQIAMVRTISPDSLTPTIQARMLAAFKTLYLRPPAVWDVPVYLDQLALQARTYFALLINRMMSQSWMGFLLAIFSAIGIIAGAKRLILASRKSSASTERLILWWSLATLGLVLFAIPFDWQRYFLPLVPVTCLLAAVGLNSFVRMVFRGVRPYTSDIEMIKSSDKSVSNGDTA